MFPTGFAVSRNERFETTPLMSASLLLFSSPFVLRSFSGGGQPERKMEVYATSRRFLLCLRQPFLYRRLDADALLRFTARRIIAAEPNQTTRKYSLLHLTPKLFHQKSG